MTEFAPHPNGLKAVEIGGPTPYYNLVQGQVPEGTIISNISSEIMSDVDPARNPIIVLDGRKMPFKDESLDVIYGSAINRFGTTPNWGGVNTMLDDPIREGVIREASRVLKPGGELIWQSSGLVDFETAIEFGFSPTTVKPRNFLPKALSFNMDVWTDERYYMANSRASNQRVLDMYVDTHLSFDTIFQKRALGEKEREQFAKAIEFLRNNTLNYLRKTEGYYQHKTNGRNARRNFMVIRPSNERALLLPSLAFAVRNRIGIRSLERISKAA